MAETLRIEIPVETVDNTEPELSNITKGFEKMEKAADSANSSAKRAGNTVTQFDRQAEKTEKSLARWAKEKYEILLEAKDKISPVLSTVGSGLKSFAGKTWSITMKAVDLVTSPLRGIINLLKNPVLQAGAVLGISFSLKDTVDTYADFEATMSRVKALSNATEGQMEKLTQKAKDMGADTKFSGTESAEAFTYMAQAGWKVEDMVDGIGGIMSLAAADGLDLATTTDIVSNALTAFGLKADSAARFADVLAVASSATNTDVSGLGEAFQYIAPVAGALKYSIEDVSLALGLMSNNAVKGSMAGTSLKTSLANMASPTSEMSEAMNKYNISLTDSEGNTKSLKEVIDNLRESLGGLSETEQTAVASMIFGKEAMAGMLGIINTSAEDYKKLTEEIENSQGAADRMAETMQDNLSGAFEQLGGAVETVQLTMGERLEPYLLSLSKWIEGNMPGIENMVSEFFDMFDRKYEKFQNHVKEMTSSDEWKNADFFGKIDIAWDEFIAEPFSEWWNSKGKAKFADFAQDIGKGIGTGLKAGVLTLLGIDISETIDEGVSIGASFARGFSEGFDFKAVSEKLLQGFGNLIKNAGKLLPGGEAADLSSVLSAVMIGKIASPFLSMGKGAFSVGKTLLAKGEAGTSMAGDLGTVLLGSAAKGTGLKGLGATMGMTGLKLGSGASSGAGLIAAGTAATAGAVAAGATLISGAMDAYRVIKSEDEDEISAYKKSALLKGGGVAAGAAAGAAIGSIIPGVGTAVGALAGAGIGGIAGWLSGNKVKKDYQQNAEEMQAMADKVQAVYTDAGVTIEKTSKFANKSLKDAFNDSELSAEEFATMFQESCSDVMSEAFGNIKLSLTEIKKLAEEITFGGMKEGIEEFNTAVSNTESSLSSLKSAVTDIKRENWKVSLGMELSETDKDGYKTAIENFLDTSQTYIDDNHYEATVALKLLTGDNADISGIDSYYSELKEQLSSLGDKLTSSVNIAMSDSVITLDEAAELESLQQQITDITNKLTDAQNEAELEAIGIKFKTSGADLSPETFTALQEQLNSYVDSAEESYGNALTVTLTNLKLQLSDGAITQEEYDSLVASATEGYKAQIAGLNIKVETFNLQTIADAYASQLEGILPEIEGTTVEKLQTALNNALLQKPDTSSWDESFIKDVFDLDGLEEEYRQNISELLIAAAESVPSSVKEQIVQSYKNSVPSVEEIMEAIDWDTFNTEMFEEIVGKQQHMINPDSDWSILDPVLEGVSEENLNTAMRNYAQRIHDALENNLDPAALSDFMKTYMSDAMSQYGPVSNEYYEQLISEWQEAGTNFGTALNTGASSSITGYSSVLKSDLQTALDTATSSPFSVNPTVNVFPRYNITSLPSIATNISASKHAAGGYVSGPQLSWLAEEGYGEFVIPTAPSRRSRALELYEQAGIALGVSAHADGGYVGGSNLSDTASDYNLLTETNRNASSSYNETVEDNQTDTVPVLTEERKTGSTSVQVSVQMSPKFTISGEQDEESIMQVIRKHMKEMADELGGEIAGKLEEVFSNMPLKEA